MANERMSETAARVVRELLVRKNRTQQWLSDETGIPQRTLARRLAKNSSSGFLLDELGLIAKALDTDAVHIVAAAQSGPRRLGTAPRPWSAPPGSMAAQRR